MDKAFYERVDEQISNVHSDMEEVLDDKRMKWDELPSLKQEGDYGEELQSVIDNLEAALDSLDGARDALQEALEDEGKKG